jgi:uncharacterized protein (TIGR02246 family)
MKACQADPSNTSLNTSKIDAKTTVGLVGGWILLLAGSLAACSARSPMPPAAARRAIEAAVASYVSASNQGDADALAALYADDAVLLPPDHEPIQGREAIGAFWQQGTDEGLEIRMLRVEVDGDLGYLVGRYNLPATEEEPADSGKSVMCLRRQPDGSWRLTADIWNRSGEADEAAGRTPGPSIS